MVKKHYKRLTLTLHEMTTSMLETISLNTKLTKSQIMQRILKAYTLSFWSEPQEAIEGWKDYANKQK